MSRLGALCFSVPMCLSLGFFCASPSLLMFPSTFHRYCDSRNYLEVTFTHSYSPDPPREFREFGNSGNCPAKRLCCKAKSLPWAWELLGSDIYSFVLTRSHSGILGIVLRNVFAVRQNHFHGFGNYWEVIFPHGKLVYQCITMQKL